MVGKLQDSVILKQMHTDQKARKRKKNLIQLSTSFTDGSYDLAILINQKKLKVNYQEDELNVEEGATKGVLKEL